MLSTSPRSACWPLLWPGKWGRYKIARPGTCPDPRVSRTLRIFGVCFFAFKSKYNSHNTFYTFLPNEAGLAPSALDEVLLGYGSLPIFPSPPIVPQKSGTLENHFWIIFSMRWIWSFLKPHNFETHAISTSFLQIWEALKRLEGDSRCLSWCWSRDLSHEIVDRYPSTIEIFTTTLTPTIVFPTFWKYGERSFEEFHFRNCSSKGQDLDGKLRRAASADELAERLKEATGGNPWDLHRSFEKLVHHGSFWSDFARKVRCELKK